MNDAKPWFETTEAESLRADACAVTAAAAMTGKRRSIFDILSQSPAHKVFKESH
jgi:hypothetical protein